MKIFNSFALVVVLAGRFLCFGQEDDQRERLRQINERMAEVNRKLERLKSEKSSILNEIYRIELEGEMARIEFSRIELNINGVQRKIDAKNREREALEKRIADSRENLRRILRVLYKSGSMGYIKFFITLRSFDQLFRNYHLITILINTKVAEIGEIRRTMAQLQRVREELSVQLAYMERLKEDKAAKMNRLNGFRDEKLTLINRINTEREYHLGMLEELKQEAENLNRVLSDSVAFSSLPPLPVQIMKGKIPWPIAGSLVSTFGKKKSDRFDTYTINNGIEIRPDKVTEIRAVLEGVVVFADYFSGYGNLIIVQHRRNFHTLYGHCETILKKKGEPVRQGERLATVGSTGITGQNTLYFEVRENLKAVNPLPWLAKK